MTLGNKIGYTFYALAIVFIILGIASVPVVSSLLESQSFMHFLFPVSEWIGEHLVIYLGGVCLLLLGFFMERTIGFGHWSMDEIRSNWVYLPPYVKWPLIVTGVVILLFNLKILTGYIVQGSNFQPNEIVAVDSDSPSLHFLSKNKLSIINFSFGITLGVVFLISHFNAPGWRRIRGAKEMETRAVGNFTIRLSPKARKRLKKAETYMEKGRYYKAAKAFELLGEEFFYRAGKLYHETGYEDKAARAFMRAGEYFTRKNNFLRAGDAYYFGGHWEKAVQAFDKSPTSSFADDMVRVREWAERRGESLYNLGRFKEAGECYQDHGLFKRAGEAFEKAELHTAAADAYHHAGAYESSVKALTDGGYDDLAWLEKGNHFFEKESYLNAAEAFEQGKHFLRAAEAYNKAKQPAKAAGAYLKAGRPEIAVELFLAAGEEARAMACYEQMGDFQGAAQLAAHLGIQDKQARYFRKAGMMIPAARAYLMIGETSGAVACMQKVDLSEPKHIAECAQIINILYEQERLREALACVYGLLEGKNFTKTLAPLLFALAKIHRKMGNIEKSYHFFCKVAQLDPSQPQYKAEARKVAEFMGETFPPKEEAESEKSVSHDLFSTRPNTIKKTAKAKPTPEPTKEKKEPGHLTNLAQTIKRSLPGVDETTLTLDEQTIYDLTQQGALERYQVIRELGRGGMGYVYKALDKKLKRFVALKMLHPEHNKEPRVVLFFKREARAIASLNHPNLVHLFDMGKERGCFYMVMEYVEGHTLKLLQERYRDFLQRNLIPIWYQACIGLKYAHEQGILHRDLKPSNLMWAKDRRLKILDFGLAKEVTDLSQTQQVWGTPSFMAPELFQGERASFASDVYGLGATFYMLATGRAPFSTEDTAAKFSGKGLPQAPIALKPDMSKSLSDTILKCMYLNPAERFETMDALMSRLKKISRKKK